jgi:hypothetical protein
VQQERNDPTRDRPSAPAYKSEKEDPKPDDKGTTALGPYVAEDNSVVKPKPSGSPTPGVIPMDADDVPEAFL